jgi:hypothetical protein
MVAVPFDPQVTSTSALGATLTLNHTNHAQQDVAATVTAVGWRGIVFDVDTGVDAGAHAWLDLALPSGKHIRPLVQLQPRVEGGTTARFVHLFPGDRQALEAYHATRSASY